MYNYQERLYLAQLWEERGAPLGNQNAAGPHTMSSSFLGRETKKLTRLRDSEGTKVYTKGPSGKNSSYTMNRKAVNEVGDKIGHLYALNQVLKKKRVDWKVSQGKSLTDKESNLKKYYEKHTRTFQNKKWEASNVMGKKQFEEHIMKQISNYGRIKQSKSLSQFGLGKMAHNAETGGFKRPGS